MLYIVDSLNTISDDIQKRIVVYTEGLKEKLLLGSISSSSIDKSFWTNVEQYSSISSQIMFYRNTIESEISNYDYQEKTIREYLVEIHKKYSIPVACFVFVLVGAPLGVMARRGGFGIAASLSLGFFLLYWASLIGGEKLADRELIDPWIGMWMANLFIGVLGLFLTYKIGRETIEINFTWWKKFIPGKIQKTLFSDTEDNTATP